MNSVLSPRAIEICYGCTYLPDDLPLLYGCRASGFCHGSQFFSGPPRLFGGDPKGLSRLSSELGAFPARLFLAPRVLSGSAPGLGVLAAFFCVKSIRSLGMPAVIGNGPFLGGDRTIALSARPTYFSLFPRGLRGIAGLLAALAPDFDITGDASA